MGKKVPRKYGDGGDKLIKLLSGKTSAGERMFVHFPETEKDLQPYSDSHAGYN